MCLFMFFKFFIEEKEKGNFHLRHLNKNKFIHFMKKREAFIFTLKDH